MKHADAQLKLKDAPLVPCTEASLLYARELEAQLLEAEIPAILGKPPAKECCSTGACACASRFQVLVAKDDFPKAMQMFQEEFQAALAEEGLGQPLMPLGAEPEGEGEPPCPACGHAAPLEEGACAGCGLQLE